MKYFTFDDTAITKLALGTPKEITIVELEEPSCQVLTSDKIKSRVQKIYAHKESFKFLISNFKNLDNLQKLTYIFNYYLKDWFAVKSSLLNWYTDQGFCKTKLIKSYLASSQTQSNGTTRAYYCGLNVLAKTDINLSKFKRYTPEEIDDLIKQEKIVILNYVLDKPFSPNGQITLAQSYLEKFFPDLNLGGLYVCETYPQIAKIVLEDVTAEELKHDYETYYLPKYKAALKYLAKCAILSKKAQTKKKKQLIIDASECDKQSQSLDEIEKNIGKLTKGR